MEEERTIWTYLAPLIVVTLVVGGLLGGHALVERQREPPYGVVRYSLWKKIFAAAAMLPAILMSWVLATSESLKPSDHRALYLGIAVFLVPGLPLLVEYFGVRHTFDGQELRYRTLWRWGRVLRWADVTKVWWNRSETKLLLRDSRGATFRISESLDGLEELARVALQNIPPQVLEASPSVRAGLRVVVGLRGPPKKVGNEP